MSQPAEWFRSFAFWEEFGKRSPLAVFAKDLDDVVRVWSPGTARLYGVAPSDAVGQRTANLGVGPIDRRVVEQITSQVLRGTPWEGEFRARTARDEIVLVHELAVPVVDESGAAVGLVGLLFEPLLRQSRGLEYASELRLLAREIRTARQRERTAVAGSLHDDLGQVLLAARLELLGCMESPPQPGDEFTARATRLLRYVDASVELTRRLAVDLLEEEFDVWDLLLGAFEITDDLQERTGVLAQCYVDCTMEQLHRVDNATASVAYSVLREALRNCERHSEADRIRASIDVVDDTLQVTVHDNGRGIPPGAEGVGTKVMRERVDRIGGLVRFSGDESPSAGAKVEIFLPLRTRNGVA